MAFHNQRRARQRGFTLIEMAIVVSIIGILSLIAMPRIERALSRRDLAAAKSKISLLLLKAKSDAVQRRREVSFTIGSAQAVLTTTTPDGASVFLTAVEFGRENGVTVSPAGALTIQPNGLILTGTPYLVRLQKGRVADSLTVTGFGRVE